MIEGAAQKAVDDVLARLESREQRLIDRMDGSVAKAVNAAVGGLTTEFLRPDAATGVTNRYADANAHAQSLGICQEEMGEQNCAAGIGAKSDVFTAAEHRICRSIL